MRQGLVRFARVPVLGAGLTWLGVVLLAEAGQAGVESAGGQEFEGAGAKLAVPRAELVMAGAELSGLGIGLAEIEKALDAGRPHAVLARLREVVPRRPAQVEGLAGEVWLLRLRAESEAGRHAEVLQLFEGVELAQAEPRERFWVAQALLATGEFEGAAKEYRSLAALRDFAFRWESALGLARALGGQGKWREALAALAPLPAGSRVAAAAGLEKARIQLALGQPDEALNTLDSLAEVSPEWWPLAALLRARCFLGLGQPGEALLVLRSVEAENLPSAAAQEFAVLRARAHAALGSPQDGLAILESWLAGARGGAPRQRAFEELDRLMRMVPAPSLAGLRRLAEDTTEPGRAAEALLILARAEARAGRVQTARELLQGVVRQADARHSLAARHELARLEIENGQLAAAVDVLAGFSDPESEFWRGIAWLVSGGEENWWRALRSLQAASDAKEAPERIRRAALWNAGLAAILLGEEPLFLGKEREGQASVWKGARLRLVAALELARRGDARAGVMLRELAQTTGKPAALPLAEWLLASGEPAAAAEILTNLAPPEAGADELAELATDGLAGGTWGQGGEEQELYLRIVLQSQQPGGEKAALEMAKEFLGRFPGSALEFRVRLKLGELAWRTGDYLRAYNELTEAAQSAPAPQDAGQAWLLAGKAASRLILPQALDLALAAYEEAAQAGGPAAERARFEQALILNAKGQNEQAIVLLERVANDSVEPAIRAVAQIELADTYYSLRGTSRENAERALAVWGSAARDPNLPAASRQQAMVKQALGLEEAGRAEEAAACLYEALAIPAESGSWFWFERAGFEAGRILEKLGAVGEAVRVLEKVAEAGGPRAGEASARASRVRLENFLWEE